MVVKLVSKLLVIRAKVAHKSAKLLHSTEGVAHVCYGVAIFTEAHGEISLYSGSALCLGIVAIAMVIFGVEA